MTLTSSKSFAVDVSGEPAEIAFTRAHRRAMPDGDDHVKLVQLF